MQNFTLDWGLLGCAQRTPWRRRGVGAHGAAGGRAPIQGAPRARWPGRQGRHAGSMMLDA